MLRIYNTLARDKQDFVPLRPGRVGMYVCGITVYDYCHLGHGRMMVAFDMVQRWLRTSGYAVTYVRNITDIEDKIIRRAVENNETIGELTARFIRAMDEDLEALGVQKPDHTWFDGRILGRRFAKKDAKGAHRWRFPKPVCFKNSFAARLDS